VTVLAPRPVALTPRVEAWHRRGAMEEHLDRQIFVLDQDGSGPPLLFLHAYPSSSYDWRGVVDRLPGRQLTCFDFLGFGLSDKPADVSYSLHLQADLAEAVAQRFAGRPVVLVAHDMGASVATELLARDLEGRLGFRLAAVLLLNASLVIQQASLTISQKLLRGRAGPLMARLSNQRAFRIQVARLFSAAHPFTDEEAADQWSLLATAGGHRLLDKLTHYLHERVAYAPRWHGALRDWPGQLELAWAGQDPVCTEAVLQAVLELRPQAKLTRLAELGHYPQLEEPMAVTAVIDRLRREVALVPRR